MKNLNKNWMKAALAAIPVSLAISCGGGGAGTDEIASLLRSENTGVLIDSPVEGVSYVSGRFSGETDSEGRFTFEEGATVRFSIGNILLGEVAAGEIITPLDLVNGATDDTNTSVVNMLRLLQTLDDDANPDNGIRIPQAIRDLARNMSVRFDLDEDDFEFDDDVMELVRSQNRRLVDRSSALHHFRRERDKLNRTRDGFNRLKLLGDDENADDVFATMDTDSDLSISETEFDVYFMAKLDERLENWFSERDQDENGEITLEEVQAHADAAGRHSNREVEHRFNKIDTDGDGILLKDEFIEARKTMAEAHADKLFARIDEDENEAISQDEWSEFAEELDDNQSKRRRHFARKDTDDDGQVSLEEFLVDIPEEHVEKATALFEFLDKDGDGFLTLKEEEGVEDDDDDEEEDDEEDDDDLLIE